MHPFILLTLLLPAHGFAPLVTAFFALYDGADASPTIKAKPDMILVHGAFHQPSCYVKVVALLKAAHYTDISVPDLPSVGNLVDRRPDIEAVRRTLLHRLDQGRDVVLVGNSYGATVISEAVKGLKHPPRGRILALVFISGYLPTINEVLHPETKSDIKTVVPSNFRIADCSTKIYSNGDNANFPPSKAFYNLLPPFEAALWSKQLDYSSYAALNATATYIPYTGDFRCVYIVGKQDNSVPPEWAKTWYQQSGAKMEVLIEDFDHVPMLSRPVELTKILRRIAGETLT
ncbi:Alpha/Beta hydrolase protein [Massariosphaeria phaeospora]|uniref:Alpha/Beta hydrolase protein n=1 Tax=Massariosphaeria phaeospora TaxID=100035 RepID=A0A7C8I262_9PLEO|nr:Alpha/Beta hydrolase protein [Massariosphaeria phaeospora]